MLSGDHRKAGACESQATRRTLRSPFVAELVNIARRRGRVTIAAAYLVSEGVVFGADSTTAVIVSAPPAQPAPHQPPPAEPPLQAPPAQTVAQLFNHAQKIFELG